MTRVALLAVFALVWIAVAGAQTPATDQIPTFRTGVDIVRLDVSVFDKDRRPIHGLTADDFTLLEDGKPQRVVAFSEVGIPAALSPTAPWMRDAPSDVFSNTMDTRRLVTIVLDDSNMPFDPGTVKLAKRIAKSAFDQLGPMDLAAVVFTYLGRNQNFTTDRARLTAAIDSLVPHPAPLACLFRPGRVGCDIDTLSNIAATLVTAPPGRKDVIFISGGRTLGMLSPDVDVSSLLPKVQQLLRDLHVANITVYAFDANGLQVGLATAADRRPSQGTILPNESLRVFAEGTGGRAFTDTNTPDLHVPEVFRETSSYYLLAFQSTNPVADGRFRKVKVTVNRSGAVVRTRAGYFAPRARQPQRAVAGDNPSLDSGFSNGLPGGDLPLTVSVAAFASPAGRDPEVVVTTAASRGTGSVDPQRIEVIATAFDQEWKSRGAYRQTVQIGGGPQFEAVSRLPLKPGRYEVRVEAESEGHIGSVYAPVDVPDFARERLSASGLVLQRTPGLPVADQSVVADLVPIVPTTMRTWSARDRVTAFLRIYQGGKDRLVPALMTTRVTDARNAVASNSEGELEIGQFGEERAADYRINVPIAHLAPGDYLLTIEAKLGARKVSRSARFTIIKEPSRRSQ